MSDAAPEITLIFERSSANDTFAKVTRIIIEAGSWVEVGDHVFDFETSKACQEVVSPASGWIEHSLRVGELVFPGQAFARICQNKCEDPGDGSSGKPGAEVERYISERAASLLKSHGLNAEEMNTRFVTSKFVRDHVLHAQTERAAESIPKKDQQIAALDLGAARSALSVVGKTLVQGPVHREGCGFFENKVLDMVVSEASRLLQEFPNLNSYYDAGVQRHHSINAGVAFSGGDNLVVYRLSDSDKLLPGDVRSLILSGLKRYATSTLSDMEINGCTFLVTDLSATGVEYILPLLPYGHSTIIAIASTPTKGFALYLGFDHRVTDGFEASLFLTKLCRNIISELGSV